MAAQTSETDAIVLNCMEHGESDLIVTLFCQDTGRLSAIAKGAKKSKKRFVNKLEFFSFLHITCQQKGPNRLAFLAEAELHSAFLYIRQDLNVYSIASVIREFLLLGIKENAPDVDIFRLSLWALHSLDQGRPPLTVLSFFLLRFYDYIGYRPELQSCQQCARPVTSRDGYSFDAGGGGLNCRACQPDTMKGIPLSHGTIKILQSGQDQPLERLHRLHLSGRVQKEALSILKGYGNHLFQREIVSWKLVRELFFPPAPKERRRGG